MGTIEPTVFIVDDDEALADALSELAHSMGLPAQCYRRGDTFLSEFDEQRPGCLLLDLRVPGTSGLEVLQRLASRNSHLPVIMITAHGDVQTGVQAMKLGAFDFLEKPFAPQQLRDIVQRAIQLDIHRREKDYARSQLNQRMQQLTPEELKVAELIAQGYTNAEIADVVSLSVRTVQFRRASIMQKLGAKTRSELVRFILSLLKPTDEGAA